MGRFKEISRLKALEEFRQELSILNIQVKTRGTAQNRWYLLPNKREVQNKFRDAVPGYCCRLYERNF